MPFNNLTGGRLLGEGTIAANVNNDGELKPGTGDGVVGILNISGAYTQTSNGTLTIEIGGPDPGTGYDRLNVSAAVTLDGALNVPLLDPFTPTPGQTFIVLTFGSSSGDFATGPEPSFTRTYDVNSLTLTATGLAPSIREPTRPRTTRGSGRR